MKDSKLFKNSYFSVLQTIVVAVAALLLFKLMVINAGLKVTGLWSYLSSITSITGFGSFGFANALLFHIPKYQVRHGENKMMDLINTTFFSVLGFTSVLCVLSYVIFNFVIPFTVNKDLVGEAHKLLPYAVISFFISGLSTTYLSVLDGLMLTHIRAKITMAGSAIFLASGYLLLQKIGITAIPVAQIIQNIFLLIFSYLVVKRKILSYRFSFGFNISIFKNIFRYGFNFQVMSVSQIISDPFMKSMITKYAGSNITAIFDFCLKLLSVFRSLIISVNQTIVPQITILKTQGKLMRIKIYYKANFQLVLFLSLVFFLAPIVLMDAISVFFLNEKSNDFNFILINVSIGLLLNAIALPAHFYYLGMGNLKWVVINNAVIAVLIFISAPLLGILAGGKYVVMCWSISAMVGSSLLIVAFNKENNFSLAPFFNKNILLLIIALITGMVVNHYISALSAMQGLYYGIAGINVFVLIVVLVYPVFTNTILKKAVRKILFRYKR